MSSTRLNPFQTYFKVGIEAFVEQECNHHRILTPAGCVKCCGAVSGAENIVKEFGMRAVFCGGKQLKHGPNVASCCSLICSPYQTLLYLHQLYFYASFFSCFGHGFFVLFWEHIYRKSEKEIPTNMKSGSQLNSSYKRFLTLAPGQGQIIKQPARAQGLATPCFIITSLLHILHYYYIIITSLLLCP